MNLLNRIALEETLKERFENSKAQRWHGFSGIGRAFSGAVGNLTGGLIGKTSQQKAQEEMIEQQKRDAEKVAEEYRKQAEAENKRRIEEAKRVAEEARRAREETEKARREAEEKTKAENDFNKQLSQDSGTLMKSSIQDLVNPQNRTTVDYSNTQNTEFKKTEDDEDIDKLKKAFKRKL